MPLHTYIFGRYNPSVRIIDLVSHTTYVVCVNFIHKWRDLQLKVDFKWQIFLRNFFMANLFTLRVFVRNLLSGNHRRNTFCILFWCLAFGSDPGFTSNKPTYYPLDYGNFSDWLIDWTLLLRKRRWSDCHHQFGVLWSYDNRLLFACYWRIQLGEYVVSTRQCHMPLNSSEYGFIARDISWLPNLSSWRYQMAITPLDFFSGATRKTVFIQINLQLLST